jgi:hypothetical protein
MHEMRRIEFTCLHPARTLPIVPETRQNQSAERIKSPYLIVQTEPVRSVPQQRG